MKKMKQPKTPPAPLPPFVSTSRQVSYDDFDIIDENATADSISRALGVAKVVSKPDISRLPNAIEGGVPCFEVGDKIVIERYCSFLRGNPYLDTKTYTVTSIDMFSGKLKLYDDQLEQNATDNWLVGSHSGNVYKLAMGNVVSTKKKRGRPCKNDIGAPAVIVPPGEKRGRGRPKGVKNRPKGDIEVAKGLEA